MPALRSGSTRAAARRAARPDETTWSARTWTTFVAQRISVALHRAAALEILQSLRMGPVEGRDLY